VSRLLRALSASVVMVERGDAQRMKAIARREGARRKAMVVDRRRKVSVMLFTVNDEWSYHAHGTYSFSPEGSTVEDISVTFEGAELTPEEAEARGIGIEEIEDALIRTGEALDAKAYEDELCDADRAYDIARDEALP
jgi:hypothetical protein